MRARPHIAVFRPARQQPAALAAAAGAVVALLLALALVVRGATDGVTFAAFAGYVVAGVLMFVSVLAGYWALAVANLRYEVGNGALTITWGLTRQVVPLAQMERVVRGRSLGMPRVEGLDVPGWPCHVGRGVVKRVGRVLFYSTHRTPAEILYLVTPQAGYGLSPADHQAFIENLQHAAAEDDGADLRQEVERLSIAALPFWTDPLAQAMVALGTLVGLTAIGVVFARYTGIPSPTVIPFPDRDHIDSKRALLGIPITAVTLLVLNTLVALSLHRLLRPIAYLLLMGGVFVQALLVVAAFLAT